MLSLQLLSSAPSLHLWCITKKIGQHRKKMQRVEEWNGEEVWVVSERSDRSIRQTTLLFIHIFILPFHYSLFCTMHCIPTVSRYIRCVRCILSAPKKWNSVGRWCGAVSLHSWKMSKKKISYTWYNLVYLRWQGSECVCASDQPLRGKEKSETVCNPFFAPWVVHLHQFKSTRCISRCEGWGKRKEVVYLR